MTLFNAAFSNATFLSSDFLSAALGLFAAHGINFTGDSGAVCEAWSIEREKSFLLGFSWMVCFAKQKLPFYAALVKIVNL